MSCPYCRREEGPEPSSNPGDPSVWQAPDHRPRADPSVTQAPVHQATSSIAPVAQPPVHQAPGVPPRNRFRGARKTGWLLPGILLVLMPKCPICLAAYIALLTGISIPITAAAWLRWTLIALCIGALVWLTARWSLYLYRRSLH